MNYFDSSRNGQPRSHPRTSTYEGMFKEIGSPGCLRNALETFGLSHSLDSAKYDRGGLF